MVAVVLFLVFAVLLLIGAPIAVCLGASSVLAMIVQGAGRPLDTIMSSLPRLVSSSTSKFVLLAIPFFILAGNIMEKAGISGKLIRLAEVGVGHLKGGLAIVCVIVSCFFAAISGSGPATVAALGLIMIPAMIKAGYKPAFAAALMGASGAIGVVIPPSITFVVYGSIADASIGTLFLAGVLPGLLMGLGLMVTALLVGSKSKLETLPKASGKERWDAFKDAFWGLLMPVIILGGIYGGIFTPTEAAAVSVIYGLFVGIFIYKQIRIQELYSLLLDSVSTTATVMFITAAASLRTDPCKTGCGDQHGAAAGDGRKHDHFLHHCQHYPSDRGLLPGFHVGAVHLHSAVRAGGKCPGYRSGASGRGHDRKPGHRTFHSAGGRQPVCGLWCGGCEPERDLQSSGAAFDRFHCHTVNRYLCAGGISGLCIKDRAESLPCKKQRCRLCTEVLAFDHGL